jgi:hypothetical protein
MLAVLLLASIAWGSTAEFTHHHSAGNQTLGSSFQTTSTVLDQTSSDQVSPNKNRGTSSNTKGGAECLICQLHQNLSTSVIGHAPGDGPTERRSLTTPLSAVIQLSEFAVIGHGRAPPATV